MYGWLSVEVKGNIMKKKDKNDKKKVKLELEILELESRVAPEDPEGEGAEC